jgi:hypothetical protein
MVLGAAETPFPMVRRLVGGSDRRFCHPMLQLRINRSQTPQHYLLFPGPVFRARYQLYGRGGTLKL